MADAAVAADLHQSLDVERHVAAQIALHVKVFVDVFAQLDLVVLGQVLDTGVRADARGGENLLCGFTADAVDIGQTNFDSLLFRQVNTSYTRHVFVAPPLSRYAKHLALTLFVLRVLADYHYAALAFNDFAFLANGFYGRSYFHDYYLLVP